MRTCLPAVLGSARASNDPTELAPSDGACVSA
jgi:hypothetical protein